jgi:hypothetical protein
LVPFRSPESLHPSPKKESQTRGNTIASNISSIVFRPQEFDILS